MQILNLCLKNRSMCKNPEKCSTTKIGEQTQMLNVNYMGVHNIGNKHSQYCGEDCVKTLYISISDLAVNVINFQKKKMLPLTKKEKSSN